jgi:hypothetical protein
MARAQVSTAGRRFSAYADAMIGGPGFDPMLNKFLALQPLFQTKGMLYVAAKPPPIAPTALQIP